MNQPGQIKCEVICPVTHDYWLSVYSSDKNVLPSLSPQWAEAIRSSGRYTDVSRGYNFSDGNRAVLPLFASRWLLGARVSSASPPPAWGFGGLTSSMEADHRHVRAVLDDLIGLPFVQIAIRPDPKQERHWREAVDDPWIRIPRRSHGLDLSGGWDEVRQRRFPASTRRKIRLAEKAGLQIESGNNAALIDDFYSLFLRSLDRWAQQQGEPRSLARLRGRMRDPKWKFETMARSMEEKFRIWIARQDGEPAAAILVLIDRQAHYTRGAMNKTIAASSYANYLLHSFAIEFACERGCGCYNMGESGGSLSLATFKERFGAAPMIYHEYRREKIPVTLVSTTARSLVKRAIGMKDV